MPLVTFPSRPVAGNGTGSGPGLGSPKRVHAPRLGQTVIEVDEGSEPSVCRSSLYPTRSSSYQVYSIINAYGGDPGIQISPVEEDQRPTNAQTLWNSIRKLRSDDQLSTYNTFDVDEAYGSGYGSGPEKMGAMADDDYDPFRQTSPLGIIKSKKDREHVIRKWYSKPLPEVQVEELPVEKVWSKEKALPPMPVERSEGLKEGEVHLSGQVQDSPTAWSPRTKLYNTEKPLPNPYLNLQEEASIMATRTLARSTKPPSLQLKNSNGSTAASLSSVTRALPDTTAHTESLSPPSPLSETQYPPLHSQGHPEIAQTHGSLSLTERSNANQGTLKSLPAITYSPDDNRPLPSLPAHVQPLTKPSSRAEVDLRSPSESLAHTVHSVTHQDEALADDETSRDKADMKRLKQLVIKRKPVRGDSIASLDSVSSNNVFQKENRPFQSTASLPILFNDRFGNSKHASTITSPLVSQSRPTNVTPTTLSPSVTPYNQSQESISETVTVISNGDETVVGLASRSPTPPKLLPPPSPVSQLDVSPSKYAIKKKSVRNLKLPGGKFAHQRISQPSGAAGNPVEVFRSAIVALQTHVKATQDILEDVCISEERIIANEVEWIKSLHPSMLHMMHDRPAGTNAPKLSTRHLHCYRDHGKWKESKNEHYPVDCGICYLSDTSTRWACTWCAVRVCTTCKEELIKTIRNTEFQHQLDLAKEGWARSEEVRRTERTLTSRPPSPANSTIYGIPSAAASYVDMSPRSHSAMSMRSARSATNLRSRQPYGYQGPRRHSDGRNVPAPADYPPPPRMPKGYRDGSPVGPPRGRSRGPPLVDINYGLGADRGRMPGVRVRGRDRGL